MSAKEECIHIPPVIRQGRYCMPGSDGLRILIIDSEADAISQGLDLSVAVHVADLAGFGIQRLGCDGSWLHVSMNLDGEPLGVLDCKGINSHLEAMTLCRAMARHEGVPATDFRLIPVSTPESYQVMSVSTGHISKADNDLLTLLSSEETEWRYSMRDTGFTLRLCDNEYEPHPDFSAALKNLCLFTLNSGFPVLELHADGGFVTGLPVFDW